MNKIKFYWINEWKKLNNVRLFTPLHLHFAWCDCGCHELSMFFIFMSIGFILTINPTSVKKNNEKMP